MTMMMMLMVENNVGVNALEAEWEAQEKVADVHHFPIVDASFVMFARIDH